MAARATRHPHIHKFNGQYQQNAAVRRQAVAARINTDTLDDQVLISSA